MHSTYPNPTLYALYNTYMNTYLSLIPQPFLDLWQFVRVLFLGFFREQWFGSGVWLLIEVGMSRFARGFLGMSSALMVLNWKTGRSLLSLVGGLVIYFATSLPGDDMLEASI